MASSVAASTTSVARAAVAACPRAASSAPVATARSVTGPGGDPGWGGPGLGHGGCATTSSTPRWRHGQAHARRRPRQGDHQALHQALDRQDRVLLREAAAREPDARARGDRCSFYIDPNGHVKNSAARASTAGLQLRRRGDLEHRVPEAEERWRRAGELPVQLPPDGADGSVVNLGEPPRPTRGEHDFGRAGRVARFGLVIVLLARPAFASSHEDCALSGACCFPRSEPRCVRLDARGRGTRRSLRSW